MGMGEWMDFPQEVDAASFEHRLLQQHGHLQEQGHRGDQSEGGRGEAGGESGHQSVRPDELKVTVSDGVLMVEGKHEEKAEDGSKMVSRMFSRKYSLPASTKHEEVVSNLSSDGVLVVTALKKALAIK